MPVSFKLMLGLMAVALLAGPGACGAGDEFQDLTAQDLKKLLDTGEPVFLLNPLPSLLFRQGHIPGSVNIRWHALATSPLLPADKDTPIVTYCMGPR